MKIKYHRTGRSWPNLWLTDATELSTAPSWDLQVTFVPALVTQAKKVRLRISWHILQFTSRGLVSHTGSRFHSIRIQTGIFPRVLFALVLVIQGEVRQPLCPHPLDHLLCICLGLCPSLGVVSFLDEVLCGIPVRLLTPPPAFLAHEVQPRAPHRVEAKSMRVPNNNEQTLGSGDGDWMVGG